MECDPQLGACLLPNSDKVGAVAEAANVTVYYVGDPMCSWCWGMSPVISAVAAYCQSQQTPFQIVMGGLRAGGGDAWEEGFRSFLRQEWQHIQNATGQPFGYTLLDRPSFNYDTEPACRAVVAAGQLMRSQGRGVVDVLSFFSAVQEKFYVAGEDPKAAGFYQTVCERTGLDFDAFAQAFVADAALDGVLDDFGLARSLRCRGFPSLIAKTPTGLVELSVGYSTAAPLLKKIESLNAKA